MYKFNNQIQHFLQNYPSYTAKIVDFNYNVELIGQVQLNHISNNITMKGIYDIRISFPKNYPDSLPVVFSLIELKKIFEHVNGDGSLCLATSLDQKIGLKGDAKLTSWYEKFVIPYFYSYEYFLNYHVMPFGERSHYDNGMSESILDVFELNDKSIIDRLLKLYFNRDFRLFNLRYAMCPCGSDSRYLDCHYIKINELCDEELLNELYRYYLEMN